MLSPRKQHDTDGAPHRPHSDYNYMLLILTTGRAFWAYLGKGCAAGRDFGTLSFVCVLLRSEFGTCTMPMRTAQMHIRSAIRMEHNTQGDMSTSSGQHHSPTLLIKNIYDNYWAPTTNTADQKNI